MIDGKRISVGFPVYGIFMNDVSLAKAVEAFRLHGFRNSDVSVLLHDKNGENSFTTEKNTKAPEGVAAGATAGILAGASFGWLAGAGVLAIPGIGPFVAAGPIMGAIAGAGIGGTVGGITGGLIGLGIPEYEAKRYEDLVKKGGMLLSVHADDPEWALKAKLIFEDCNGVEVSSSETSSEKDMGARIYNERYENEGKNTNY